MQLVRLTKETICYRLSYTFDALEEDEPLVHQTLEDINKICSSRFRCFYPIDAT